MARMQVTLDRDLADYLEALAKEKRTDIGGLIEQGVRILQVAREQRKIGRSHLGFVSDPTKLDVHIIIL